MYFEISELKSVTRQFSVVFSCLVLLKKQMFVTVDDEVSLKETQISFIMHRNG